MAEGEGAGLLPWLPRDVGTGAWITFLHATCSAPWPLFLAAFKAPTPAPECLQNTGT